MIGITLKELKVIWNDKPMLAAADRAKHNTLSKFGGYTRKIAKNSIKTSNDPNKHAPPGKPPIGHNGNPRYKDWIFSFVDKTRGEVVIGAIKLPRKDSQIVPENLEHGGNALIPKKRSWRKSKKIAVQMQARPHMKPAYDKAVEKLLPQLLANSIVP